eukprot:TRINITY_DN82636_c0_g1_i1.p1 TRINITY_DN82636_c0_g1~~TRINITY_DN82636_c0_g1_i1.p1  ORF type:complete len:227 (+),score=26.93 TRINITY_DN82636_c0_g1_i1:70-750(+)
MAVLDALRCPQCDIAGDTDEEYAENERRFPIEDLPELPSRGAAFWTEPFMGICVVGVLCAILIAVTSGVSIGTEATQLGQLALILIWVEAGIAVFCTAYLLFADAGVIQRSEETCYPIPAEIEELLRQNLPIENRKNITGPSDSSTQGSYCVRCLLWRPRNAGKVHHCNVCQRCVTGFDHHCGVFGRCIVAANMPCFMANIGMLFAGMITAMMAVMSSNAVAPETA